MSNRKTIQQENKSGEFTTVSYKILRDKNLSPISRILLIEILSDSDSFTMSPTMYMNRLGVTKKTLYKSINQLEEFGYVKKTDITKPSKSGKVKKVYHYLISPYGNLNTESKTSDLKEDIQTIDTIIPEVKEEPLKPIKDVSKDINNDIIELEIIALNIVKRIVNKVIDNKPIKGTKKQVNDGTNKLIKLGLQLFNENKNDNEINTNLKKKVMYINNEISNIKTRNLDQRHQN